MMATRSMVVLAAGMGSRYGGLKQLDQLGPAGETIMDYSVLDARRAGVDKVVFVIRREFETEFRDRVAARYERALEVRFAFQGIPEDRSKPWGNRCDCRRIPIWRNLRYPRLCAEETFCLRIPLL